MGSNPLPPSSPPWTSAESSHLHPPKRLSFRGSSGDLKSVPPDRVSVREANGSRLRAVSDEFRINPSGGHMRHVRVHAQRRPATRSLTAVLLASALLLTGSGTALAEGGALAQEPAEIAADQPSGAPETGSADAERSDAEAAGTGSAEQTHSASSESNQDDESDQDDVSAVAGSEEAGAADSGRDGDAAGATEPETNSTDATQSDGDDATIETEVDEAADLSPMSVPNPSGDSAVITVKVGGDRTGNTTVGGLHGAKLRLYDGGNSGPTQPVNEDWAECISDGDGDCSFTIPETRARETERGRCLRSFLGFCFEWEEIVITPGGENYDRRFWVVLESAPQGWNANEILVTGETNSQQATDYHFRTGTELRAGTTYRSTSHFMTGSGDSNREASTGTWQLSRANPTLPLTCEGGLNVALVLDLSGSVAQAGATQDLKNAAIGFTQALEGNGSSIALYTFATTAPRNNGNSGRNYALMPIDGNVQTITNRINNYVADGGTNWDRGIYQVAQSNNDYDLAVVVTDGLPTFSGTGSNPSGPGSFTRFIETEQAVYSANALKSQGTRTLAVGVGSGISGNPANLAAVSGPTRYSSGASINTADYFQASWQNLTPLLEDVARGATCQAGVTVTKIAEPYGGSPAPASGWDFNVTRTGGSGHLTPADTQTTNQDGQVEYTVQFDSMTATASMRVAELASQAQTADGWRLDQVTCQVNGEPVATTIENHGVTIAGLGVGDDAECIFTNVQRLIPGIEEIG